MSERQPNESAGGGRSPAEEGAAAAILALEDDLERERQNAAASLQQLQRSLHEAEAKAAATATVTDRRPDRAEQRSAAQGPPTWPSGSWHEFASQVEAACERVLSAEKQLLDEADRVRREADRRFAEQAEAMRAEAERRVRATAESVRAETEQRLRAQIAELTSTLERERARRDEVTPAVKGPLRFLSRRTEQRAQPEPGPKPKAKTKTKAKAKDRPRTRVEDGRVIDANAVTFEDLRGMGLSITQATRVIAYRERAEGFESVDDMDTIPGFDRDLLEQLKKRLRA